MVRTPYGRKIRPPDPAVGEAVGRTLVALAVGASRVGEPGAVPVGDGASPVGVDAGVASLVLDGVGDEVAAAAVGSAVSVAVGTASAPAAIA